MQFWMTIGLILVLSALDLTYEVAAGRVLAPLFGTSLFIWTTVIAVVLAAFGATGARRVLAWDRACSRVARRDCRRGPCGVRGPSDDWVGRDLCGLWPLM